MAVPGIQIVPLRTPTLPPATHTNTYVVGEGALSVFDPASPWEDEQGRLAGALEQRIAAGEHLERIVLTHHHHDHVAGAVALQQHFSTPDRPIPIAAHAVTAQLLQATIPVDVHLDEGSLQCGGRTLTALHTPGHAPGHLVFHDAASGAVVAGDMVAGVGTILIDPREGDLGHYLSSLERMRALGAVELLPAHGPALRPANAVLDFYIAHRHMRTEQIRKALDRQGSASAAELVPAVYAEIDRAAWPLAAVQIEAHLLWMERYGIAHRTEDSGRWVVARRGAGA